MKVFKTSKLYFGKWLYRIETTVPGACLIKRQCIEEVKEFCHQDRNRMWGRQYTTNDKTQLLNFINVLEPLLVYDVKLRGEWNSLNLYLNDPNVYQTLVNKLEDWIVSITEPATEEDVTALKDSSTIIRDTLPYDKFQYRVYLRSSMQLYERQKALAWFESYSDNIKPSKGTLRWLSMNKPWFQDPFIYVSDRNQLLLVTLFLGEHLRNTQEFVLRNTVK